MSRSFRAIKSRATAVFVIAIGSLMLSGSTVRAGFHLWNLNEIYTNSSGSLQFIELFDPMGGQNFVNGFSIMVSNVGNTQTNTFVVPGNPLAGETLNRSLLFGTAGVQAAGGPAPDYIIPNNFLFQAGGTISFFGANSGPYTALPTDGLNSRTWTGGNALNSPTNYAGQTGFVNGVPEPSTLVLSSLGVGLYGFARRRWRRRSSAQE